MNGENGYVAKWILAGTVAAICVLLAPARYCIVQYHSLLMPPPPPSSCHFPPHITTIFRPTCDLPGGTRPWANTRLMCRSTICPISRTKDRHVHFLITSSLLRAVTRATVCHHLPLSANIHFMFVSDAAATIVALLQ